jgi:hypothetical protein
MGKSRTWLTVVPASSFPTLTDSFMRNAGDSRGMRQSTYHVQTESGKERNMKTFQIIRQIKLSLTTHQRRVEVVVCVQSFPISYSIEIPVTSLR